MLCENKKLHKYLNSQPLLVPKLTNYSCGLSTTTRVLMSVCVCVYVCVCVCRSVYTITQKLMVQLHLKLERILVYENSSDEFDIGHCPIKVKVTALL